MQCAPTAGCPNAASHTQIGRGLILSHVYSPRTILHTIPSCQSHQPTASAPERTIKQRTFTHFLFAHTLLLLLLVFFGGGDSAQAFPKHGRKLAGTPCARVSSCCRHHCIWYSCLVGLYPSLHWGVWGVWSRFCGDWAQLSSPAVSPLPSSICVSELVQSIKDDSGWGCPGSVATQPPPPSPCASTSCLAWTIGHSQALGRQPHTPYCTYQVLLQARSPRPNGQHTHVPVPMARLLPLPSQPCPLLSCVSLIDLTQPAYTCPCGTIHR